jgi:hypothetical protein
VTATIIAVAYVIVSVLAVWVWVRLGRTRRPSAHDVGPDQLRLLEEMDAHLDEYVAEDPDLWDVFGRGGNWDVQAGLDRLRQAIRDEQQKETGDA